MSNILGYADFDQYIIEIGMKTYRQLFLLAWAVRPMLTGDLNERLQNTDLGDISLLLEGLLNLPPEEIRQLTRNLLVAGTEDNPEALKYKYARLLEGIDD